MENFALTLSKLPNPALATAFFTVRRTAFIQLNLPIRAARKGWRWSWPTARTDLIAPQASFNALINQNDHTATFPLAARYYATSMPVTQARSAAWCR
jgi:minor fimbrial subunit